MENEYIYWIAIAHMPQWSSERKNSLVIEILHKRKMSLQDFFESDENILKNEFNFTNKELIDFKNAKESLVNLSFQVEKLLNDVQHLDTRVVFKDNSPDLFVRHSVIPTKEIVNAYAAAKDSDLVISL